MVAASLLLVWPLHASGAVYAVAAVVVGAVFLREAHLLHARVRRGAAAAPMRLFHWSITYLALLFLAVAVDQLV
jgi:protoheme IX farnesyltransferase